MQKVGFILILEEKIFSIRVYLLSGNSLIQGLLNLLPGIYQQKIDG